MALGTRFGQGNAITFDLGGTQYETNIVGIRESVSTSGGSEITTADGVTHRTAQTGTVTQLAVTVAQDLTAAALWRYLRETTSTTGTITITGTSSATEGTSNPAFVYSVLGWTPPPLEWSPNSEATPEAVFTVSGNPTIDTTP